MAWGQTTTPLWRIATPGAGAIHPISGAQWQLQRLLYLGALAQITARSHKPAGEDWLWKMLQRKPVKLVAIALAARMARTVWVLINTGECYRVMPG